MNENRWQPQSAQAEQAVLGALLIAQEAWDEVADEVTEEDFYHNEHRITFRAIASLQYQSKAVDVVTVDDWLTSAELSEEVGGIAYLGSLAQNTPSVVNIKAYAGIVREYALLRRMFRAGAEISEMALNPGNLPVREVVDYAERKILEIADSGAKKESAFVGVGKLLSQALDQIENARESKDGITGIPSGLKDLDQMTRGLQNGDLIIIAGRPSMGKTALAMNIAAHNALRAESKKAAVAVFSMEMPGQHLAMRLLASVSNVDQERLRAGNPTDEQWGQLATAVGRISSGGLFIDDSPALSPSEIRARTRRIKREHGLSLVVVDYLQLMQIPGFKEGRTAEIGAISRALKELAKEVQVPVIALSQLNRNLEQRPDKRPVMSDLRESGGIEQDADLILFVYRDVVYHPDIEEDRKPIAELIIGKQRNGPIGTCRTRFSGQYLRFDNLITGEFYER